MQNKTNPVQDPRDSSQLQINLEFNENQLPLFPEDREEGTKKPVLINKTGDPLIFTSRGNEDAKLHSRTAKVSNSNKTAMPCPSGEDSPKGCTSPEHPCNFPFCGSKQPVCL